MYIVNLDHKMQFQALSNEGAEKVKVKYLINKPAGAQNSYLTYYSVEKGGHTPLDNHVNEHERVPTALVCGMGVRAWYGLGERGDLSR